MLNKHKKWQEREIDKDAVYKKAEIKQCVPCQKCFCLGNNECKHECLNKERLCVLDDTFICPWRLLR